MMRWRFGAVAVICMTTFGAGGAAAQVLPFERNDGDRARAELTAAVFGQFQAVVGDWVKAVNAGDLHAAAALYDEDALVLLGAKAVGRDQVEESLRQWLQGIGSVSFGLTEFDASTSLSYGAGHISVTGVTASGEDQGTMILVLRRHGRDDWKIRSQTLLLE